jgi:hypothetical protein
MTPTRDEGERGRIIRFEKDELPEDGLTEIERLHSQQREARRRRQLGTVVELSTARPARPRREAYVRLTGPLAITSLAFLASLGSLGAGAYAGALPGPMQEVAQRVLGAPPPQAESPRRKKDGRGGAQNPGVQAPGQGGPTAGASDPTSTTIPVTSVGTSATGMITEARRLCTAYVKARQAGDAGESAAALTRLRQAAGPLGVPTFCAAVLVPVPDELAELPPEGTSSTATPGTTGGPTGTVEPSATAPDTTTGEPTHPSDTGSTGPGTTDPGTTDPSDPGGAGDPGDPGGAGDPGGSGAAGDGGSTGDSTGDSTGVSTGEPSGGAAEEDGGTDLSTQPPAGDTTTGDVTPGTTVPKTHPPNPTSTDTSTVPTAPESSESPAVGATASTGKHRAKDQAKGQEQDAMVGKAARTASDGESAAAESR